MAHAPAPLKHLQAAWFVLVAGLCSLALAWQQAQALMGAPALALAWALAALAAGVAGLLAAAGLLRAWRHPGAWADDARHPVRHPWITTPALALVLLATLVAALGLLPPGPALLLWAGAALLQTASTGWMLWRLWRGWQQGGPGRAPWAGLTPLLLLPVTGQLLLPLAGLPPGQAGWVLVPGGLGLLLWPLVLVLLVLRIRAKGLWAERLLPSAFLVVAPPAALGLVALQAGAPRALAWLCWALALAGLVWAARQARRLAGLPFSVLHWALALPLALLAGLTLRLATPGGPLVVLGPGLLALATLVVGALSLATLRGLRDGSLLAPEPLASIVPVAA